MKTLLSTAALAAMIFVPASASAQLVGNLDNSTVLGGAIGAGLGGVIGSQIAPSGNRTEGSAIGAVVGGLAGAAYGNSQSTYYANPYAGQFNPGFNGRNLAGTALGAGFGGAIGSNLAGSGQREEGTAIGAVLGGLAGYSLANGRSNARYGGTPAPVYGGGYAAPAYNVTLPGTYVGGARRTVTLPGTYAPSRRTVTLPGTYAPAYRAVPAPAYAYGGYVVGPILPVTTYSAPRVQPVQTTVIRKRIRVEPDIIQRDRVVVDRPCPSGTTQQHDGTCLSAPRVIREATPTVIPSYCPAGTTDLGNGTCQEPAKTIVGSAPVIVNQPCPYGTTDLGSGTCEVPARIVEQAPVYIPPAYVTPNCPEGSYYDGSVCIDETPTVMEEPPLIIEETISGGEYCYGDGKRMYDETGRVIPGYRHDGIGCKHDH